jgi:hypothetical protein
MTDDQLYHQMREAAWRRKLTPAEDARLRAWLAAHPDQSADWEAESLLNDGLSRLPDVPMPSNFTAVVLQRVELESRTTTRGRSFTQRWKERLWWRPRLGFAALVLVVGLLSYESVQEMHRREIGRSVSVVSEVAGMPSPEALKDFDAIRALPSAPAPDEELLRLMQ